MKILGITGRRAAFGAVGVLAAVGVGGTAYAATSSSGSTPAPSGVTAATPATPAAGGAHHARARKLLDRADHATVEIKVKGQWVTYTIDRGKVTAVSPTSITLLRPDGQSVTDSIGSTTKFTGVTSESAIKTQAPATVLSDNGAALRIHQGTKAAAGPA